MDLTHLSFVHTDTIGNDEITRFPCRTERENDVVRMTRMMHDVDPAPFYKMAGGFPGNVDRWQIVETTLPSHTDVDVGCADIGSGVLDGDRNRVRRLDLAEGDLQFFLGRFSLHQVTPNAGDSDRLLLIMSFSERPGMVGSRSRVKDLYGKVTEVHTERAGLVRADHLFD